LHDLKKWYASGIAKEGRHEPGHVQQGRALLASDIQTKRQRC
jgi:hypothetical protein